MKIYYLLLALSLLLGINCTCSAKQGTIESPNAEECFSRKVTSDEINDGADVNNYVCCYIKQFESSNSECFTVEKSEISTIVDTFKNSPSYTPYAVGCSLDQLPDESKSSYCTIQNPISKNYCFTRTLNDSEKATNEGFTPDKCCYFETNSVINHCMPLESSKTDEYIEKVKEAIEEHGQSLDGFDFKAYCNGPSGSDSSNKNSDSSQSLRNNKLVLIIFLMFLLI